MRYTTKTNLASVLLVIVLTIVNNILLNNFFQDNMYEWIQMCGWLSIISLIFTIILFMKTGIGIVSYACIFVILSYVFHLGQVFLMVLNNQFYYEPGNYVAHYPRGGVIFAYNIIQVIVITIFYVHKQEKISKEKNEYSKSQLKIMAWSICAISVPLRLIYTIDAIITSRQADYGESLNLGYSGVFIQFSMFYVIGFVLLIVAYEKQKKIVNLIFICEILFSLFSMLSGGRIYSTVCLIILCLTYYCCVLKRLKIKLVLLCIVGIIMFAQIISAISILRAQGGITIGNLLNAMLSFEDNVLLSILNEFGSSIYTVNKTYVQVPNEIEFANGLTYLKGLASMGVDLGNGIAELVRESKYATNLNDMHAYGGSFIGELYYNFGYWSYAIVILIGIYITKLSDHFKESVKNGQYIKLSMLIMPMYYSLIWIRGYFTDIVRASVWGIIFVLIFACIAKIIKSRRL